MGSLYNITTMTGARKWWNAGYTGKGIDIALIDSGVAAVDGLTGAGKVANGPDLSFESQAPNLQYLDTFGHGTHMAGVMAGRSDTAVAGAYVNDTANFLGMAPDARVVSVKVADAHGAADVSQVIAAIDWVVQHKADSGFNIKVINLSYGTNTTQAYTLDPLAYASEQAWKKGLVVVAAAGNSGYQRGNGAPGLADPAYDPYDIAVGAADPMGTTALTDDTVASYSASACSSGCKNPSFVAPGSHIVSLRDPGSLIDQTYSSTGLVSATLFRGSGTSQAAAVVSGAVALILQKFPTATPDQVKQLLATTVTKLAGAAAASQGAGEINLTTALAKTLPKFTQSFTNSTGTGSLDTSRGQGRLAMNGVSLTGNYDIFGGAFSPSSMAKLESSATSWSGGTWNGNAWSGNAWSGTSWTAKAWSGVAWSAKSWSGNAWSGVAWSAATWDTLAKAWSGANWSSNNWLAGTWSNDAWANSVWATGSWN
jgi:serine protease AprX